MKYDLEIKRTFEKVALGVLKILGFEIVEIKTVPLEMQTGKIVVDFLAVVKKMAQSIFFILSSERKMILICQKEC